ncbi:hypothetical protein GO599_04545 [Sulfolobus islandicus]|nr:hypothetical protein GO599_04545 [Sulfolobus islandicus]
MKSNVILKESLMPALIKFEVTHKAHKRIIIFKYTNVSKSIYEIDTAEHITWANYTVVYSDF